MATTQVLRVEREIFDLGTFDDVRLGKDITASIPETTSEALEMLGNDQAALMGLLKDAFLEKARKAAESALVDWRTFADDEQKELNGAYEGQFADAKAVGSFILNIAKNVYGYSKELAPEQKKAKKDMAKVMVKNNAEIRAGLAENCKAA